MEVENIRALFAWSNDTLKAELTSRQLRFKAHASKAELVERAIADMLRIRAAAASSSAERQSQSYLKHVDICHRLAMFAFKIFLIQQECLLLM